MKNRDSKIKRKRLKPRVKLIISLLILFLITHSIVNLFKPSQAVADELLESNNKTSYTNSNTIQNSVFPENVYGVPVYTDLIEKGTEERTGEKRTIKYLVIHETDNFEEGVGAKNHAKYLKENNTSSTSWHYTVDDKEIYHHIPDDERANHAGNQEGNDFGVGIELCVNKDGNFEKTFENAAKLVAYLLKSYNLNITAIKTHHDFTGKDCPHTILENNRLEEFKEKVEYYLKI